MDNEKARLILSAYRSNGEDAADPLFREALEQAARDPALVAWWEDQRRWDDAMRGALATVAAPEKLKESILLTPNVLSLPERRKSTWPIWGIAASITLVALVITLGLPWKQRTSFADLSAELIPLTDQHDHALEVPMHEVGRIRHWLARQGAPDQFVLPAGLRDRAALACEAATIGGERVAILCFPLEDGKVAHLYVMKRDAFRELPGDGEPMFQQKGAYALASWSDNGLGYVLIERGDMANLRRLL